MHFPFHRLNERLERIEKIMADLLTGFNDLTKVINALVAEDASVVAAIKDLQAQVGAGSPVTGDQLEALATQVSTVVSDLSAAIKPLAPVITSAATASGTNGTAFSFTFTASGSKSTWSLSAPISNLSFDGTTGVLSGTPNAAGTFTATVTATNPEGSAMQDFTLTVA